MVPYLTRFEPLGEMVIFGTYLRAGRGSEPIWLRGPKTSPKVPVIYGATSGGPNPKLMMTLKKACPLPLNTIMSDSAIFNFSEDSENPDRRTQELKDRLNPLEYYIPVQFKDPV